MVDINQQRSGVAVEITHVAYLVHTCGLPCAYTRPTLCIHVIKLVRQVTIYVHEHNHAGIWIMQGFASCRDLHHLAGQKLILTRLPSQKRLIWQD